MKQVIINGFEVSEFIEILRDVIKQENSSTPTGTQAKEILSIDEAADLLGLSKQTLYSYTSKGLIPHHKRFGKLYFLYSEILGFIKEETPTTPMAIIQEAEIGLISANKRRRRA